MRVLKFIKRLKKEEELIKEYLESHAEIVKELKNQGEWKKEYIDTLLKYGQAVQLLEMFLDLKGLKDEYITWMRSDLRQGDNK